MSEIKDTRSIAADAVRDEDILLDNNDWLRGRNQAGNANVNLFKIDTGDRLHLGDASTSKPIVMGIQLASDPTGVTAGFYYNTTDNEFKFYNGTTWRSMAGATYPLLATDGSASAPSYSFASDTNTGIFLIAADVLGLAVGGATKFAMSSTDINFTSLSTNYLFGASVAKFWNTPGTFGATLRGNAAQTVNTLFQLPIDNGTNGYHLVTDGTGITSWVSSAPSYPLLASLGSASAPSYSFSGDTNTGIFSAGADNVQVATGGSIRMAFQNTNTLLSTPLQLDTGSGISMFRAANDFKVTLSPSSSMASNTQFTLPPDNGTNGYLLSTNGSGVTSWIPVPAGSIPEKESFTLTAGNITNGYIDLANVADTDSIDFVVSGLVSREGADYTVSYTGGAGGNTRITFSAHTPALIENDIVVVKYQY